MRTIGLAGTRFTMESPIYAARVPERFGLRISLPEANTPRTGGGTVHGELANALS